MILIVSVILNAKCMLPLLSDGLNVVRFLITSKFPPLVREGCAVDRGALGSWDNLVVHSIGAHWSQENRAHLPSVRLREVTRGTLHCARGSTRRSGLVY